MKRIILLLAILMAGGCALAQSPTITGDTQKEGEIYVKVDVPPSFPGGEKAMYKYLANNIRYPEMAREADIQGKVVARFIVEKDGSISNITILKDIGGGCGQEVERIIRQMPKWKPGKMEGKPIRAEFTLPVTFNLQ